ncbi:MAG: AbrB/MazE/SpoVT family DNA-binding domain-containing protein [Candidatus Thermoplasmatota archaeon]
MSPGKVLPYPCRCGGKLVEAPMHVEYFGIDFGVRVGHACTRCGDEYLTDAVWQEIEDAAKKSGIFGIEKKVRVRKSGNSLVVTIPPEIARYIGITKDSLVSLVPTGKRKVELEASG